MRLCCPQVGHARIVEAAMGKKVGTGAAGATWPDRQAAR